MSENIIDCRSEEGITIGLVDSIISVARILAKRPLEGENVGHALQDLASDEDVAHVLRQALLSQGPDAGSSLSFDQTRQADEPGHRLRVYQTLDGDRHVLVMVAGQWIGVEFCTRQGGGRSPRVWKALQGLADAIVADNHEYPLALTPSYPPHFDTTSR